MARMGPEVGMGDWRDMQYGSGNPAADSYPHPRWIAYRVTFDELQGGSVARRHVRWIRYGHPQDAHELAERKFGSSGRSFVGIRPESALEGFVHGATRFTIRALRIAAGAMIALVGYAFLSSIELAGADTPISGLTLGELFSFAVSVIIYGGVFLAGLLLAWWIAFGDGPNYEH